MKQRKIVIGLAAVVLVGIGWYLFRPELLFVNDTVNEALPAASAQALASAQSLASAQDPAAVATGRFRSVAHSTEGTATIHRLGDGRQVLRLMDFATSNGPDVRVYLVAASDARDNDTIKKAGFIDLGAMKGNRGNQNYDLPAGVDLQKHRAVTIWCRRFGVNFATAPLAPAGRS